VSHTLSFRSRIVYDPARVSIDVPVRLVLGKASADVVAKLYTGSSHCVFRRAIADALGLEVETGEPMRIGTVTGSFLTYGHNVRLEAAGFEIDTTVYFAVDPAVPRNVLGRRGWIERLRLGLVDYDGQLFLSHYDEPDDESNPTD
jgi:hypothetical protein